jgi:Holliday junction resolvase RusA-like endonuclease
MAIEIVLNVKPLSVNECWQGRRFKTDAYKKYEKDCFTLLPKKAINPNAKLDVTLTYFFSNDASDVDNPTKILLDVLQKKYFFNDKNIIRLLLIKELCKKGEERTIIHIKELPIEEKIKKIRKKKNE